MRIVSVMAAVVIGFVACQDPFDGNDPDTSPGYRVVDDNPVKTVGIDELLPDADGSPELYVRLNRSGYEVREYPVEFRGMDYYDLIIALKHSEDVRVGHGDSGSPIVDGEGHVVAALYAGDPTNKEVFFARPIEDMTRELTISTVRAAADGTDRDLLLSRHFVGIDADTLLEIRDSLGLPRERIVAHREAPSTVNASGSGTVDASQDQSDLPSPIAGTSILLRYLDGDMFRSYISGTITYTAGDYSDGGSLLAFGHGVVGAGTASVPAYPVPAVSFIESDRYPYKVVDPFVENAGGDGNAQPVGFLVREAFSGAALERAATYPLTDVTSEFTLSGPNVTFEPAMHQVAPTTRSTQDHYFQTLAILAPLIYHWEQAYSQEGGVTVRFDSFKTAEGAELQREPLEITYDDYLSGEDHTSYLGYIVNEVYQLIRDVYREQPAGTRFQTISTEVTLTTNGR